MRVCPRGRDRENPQARTNPTTRSWTVLALALALMLVAGSACGTRRSHPDVVAAAGGASRFEATGGAGQSSDAGGPDTAGASSAALGGAAGAGTGESGQAGSGGQGRTAGGTSAGASSASKSAVRIGVVGTLSGVAGTSLAPQARGVQVWARWINDRGGVNGHPVEVITGDDGADPARHRALVQQFVEQKKVLAFVGNPELFTGASSVDYLTKAGVPVIGSDGGGQWFYQSPVYFPQGSSGTAFGDAFVLGAANETKKRGFTKLGTIACVESSACTDVNNLAPGGFAKYGQRVVYQSRNSLGQPDFTAECLNASRAGAQFLVAAMDANTVQNIARSCARQNYHPLLVTTAGETIPDMKNDPNLDGMVVVTLAGPWFSDGAPLVQEFVDAMAKYAPGTDVVGGDMLGWASAKVFELGTRQLPEPPTSKAIVDALQAIHGDPLSSIAGPLLYNRGAPATPAACAFTIVIRNKSWTSDGNRPCT